MVVGTHEVVAGGLAGAVGAVRLVLVGLREGRVGFGQGAVYLVGGYMQKPERSLGIGLQATKVGPHALQQVEGAHDIGLNEVLWSVDGAVHMALGGKVEDGSGLVLGQQRSEERRVGEEGRSRG